MSMFNHWFEFDNTSEEEMFKNRIKELKKYWDPIKEERDKYRKICLFYSEEIYKFLGNFRQDNLDPKQSQALLILKQVVDTCLEEGRYKDTLEHKYIKKDYLVNIDDMELNQKMDEIQQAYLNDVEF